MIPKQRPHHTIASHYHNEQVLCSYEKCPFNSWMYYKNKCCRCCGIATKPKQYIKSKNHYYDIRRKESYGLDTHPYNVRECFMHKKYIREKLKAIEEL